MDRLRLPLFLSLILLAGCVSTTPTPATVPGQATTVEVARSTSSAPEPLQTFRDFDLRIATDDGPAALEIRIEAKKGSEFSYEESIRCEPEAGSFLPWGGAWLFPSVEPPVLAFAIAVRESVGSTTLSYGDDRIQPRTLLGDSPHGGVGHGGSLFPHDMVYHVIIWNHCRGAAVQEARINGTGEFVSASIRFLPLHVENLDTMKSDVFAWSTGGAIVRNATFIDESPMSRMVVAWGDGADGAIDVPVYTAFLDGRAFRQQNVDNSGADAKGAAIDTVGPGRLDVLVPKGTAVGHPYDVFVSVIGLEPVAQQERHA